MSRIAEAVARVETHLDELTPQERRSVRRSVWSDVLEMAFARARIAHAAHDHRLRPSEAAWMVGVLDRWATCSLSEQVVFWRALAEITRP